jgi:hypothetical protein
LVELFRATNDKNAWVRVPVIQYLQACPLPQAKAHLAELQRLDPGSFRRASFALSLGRLGGGAQAETGNPPNASSTTTAQAPVVAGESANEGMDPPSNRGNAAHENGGASALRWIAIAALVLSFLAIAAQKRHASA